MAGSLETLRIVLEKLVEQGNAFSYDVVKWHCYKTGICSNGQQTFLGFDVDIFEGHRVLGSVIDSDKIYNYFRKEKLTNYSSVLSKPAKQSRLSTQNLYKSFTNRPQHKLTFSARATSNSDSAA